MYSGVVKLGISKATASNANIFKLGLVTGPFIGFAACFAMTVEGACQGIQCLNPGLSKLIYSMIFPMGMLMTTITGGELFTGNTLTTTTAWIEGKIKLIDLLKSWTISYVSNLLGSVLFAALVMKADILPRYSLPLSIAYAKVALPFDVVFIRSVLCNWLVSMAVYMSSGCLSMTGKAIAIWFPICAFVYIGLEHSVANMFLIPFGMMSGADITVSQFLMKNLVPVTLGNLVGAILFVITPYATSFGTWLQKHKR